MQQNFLPKDGSLSSQAKKVSLKEIDPVFPRKLAILPKKISGLWRLFARLPKGRQDGPSGMTGGVRRTGQ
ncbi:MAG: hypothetical protein KDE24_36650, partial [Caldilinea sp.]|nr:hypothetical protein [Caldilinea sp.]